VTKYAWNCVHDAKDFVKRKFDQYSCDPDDPHIPINEVMMATDPLGYLNDNGLPICPPPSYSQIFDEVANYTKETSELPPDSKYWKEWALRNPLPTDENAPHSGLVPNVLLDRAEENPRIEALSGLKAPKSSLESTGRIVFSGGGGYLKISLSSEQLKTMVTKADIGPKVNSQLTFSAEGKVNLGATIKGVGVAVRPHAKFHLTVDHKVLSGNDISEATSVSFSLSDPDVDDEFHVDVYFDPKVSFYLRLFLFDVSMPWTSNRHTCNCFNSMVHLCSTQWTDSPSARTRRVQRNWRTRKHI